MQELSGVSEAARDRALARFRLIQPYLEQRRSLQLVASDANLSFRTAHRWLSQYRKLRLAAFVRKARGDRSPLVGANEPARTAFSFVVCVPDDSQIFLCDTFRDLSAVNEVEQQISGI